ncbi:MAG: hypothetical protein ACYC6L_06065 [Anaerolineae bacterium]
MKTRVLVSLALVFVLAMAVPHTALAVEGPTQTTQQLVNQQELTGTLQGNHAGAFFYANIDYPGADNLITLNLQVAPADPVILMGVGLNLYGSNGTLLGQATLVDNGHLQLQYSSSQADQLLVQIYNYIDNSAVDFNVSVDGLPEVAATDTTVTDVNQPTDVTLIPPSVEAEGGELRPMTGQLSGSSGGSFDHYAVFYGAAGQVTITMYYFPADNIIADAVDLSVYDPNGEVAYTSEKVDSNGILTLSFNAQDGVRYEVVVGNWDPNITISYNIDSSLAPVSVSIGG